MTAVEEYRHADLDPGMRLWLALAADVMDDDREAGLEMFVSYIAAITEARRVEVLR